MSEKETLELVLVEFADLADRTEIARLVSAYQASEGLTPRPERISSAINQRLQNQYPGILLVAREGKRTVGVALAVYSVSAELGRVLVVNDFYIERQSRRKGIGRALAQKLLDEARKTQVDRIDLEILPTNKIAVIFWKSLGFRTHGRKIYSLDID